MKQHRVIFDTDPGLDDAVAILFLLGARADIELLGLTTVAGNVGVELTTRNARIVCEWAGRGDVPVYAGADRPLVQPYQGAEHVHGASGLDGAPLHEPVIPVRSEHAVDFIIDTLRREPPGSVTLCPVGPLSNIALALRRAPDIAARIGRIVLMGGGYFAGGNMTPAAEFNIHTDPHAADIVLRSGAPIVMLPLDVTHQATTTPARVALLRDLPNRCGPLAASLLTSLERYDVQKLGQDGAPVHDPCVIAYLLRPDLFRGRTVNVVVELAGHYTTGATVVDWHGESGREPNALYLTEVDADGLFQLMAEALAHLP